MGEPIRKYSEAGLKLAQELKIALGEDVTLYYWTNNSEREANGAYTCSIQIVP